MTSINGSIDDFLVNRNDSDFNRRILSERVIRTPVSRLTRSADPATGPITLAEAKTHMRVDNSDEDTLITNLITAAAFMAENMTDSSFVTQTWVLSLDRVPFGRILELPRPPLQSVTLVESSTDAGVDTTFAASNYTVDTSGETIPGRLALLDGKVWPSALRKVNALRVTYVTGYGVIGDVPQQIKSAVKSLVAVMFENREELDPNGKLTAEARMLLAPFKVWKV